ncbi:hypothetical protein FRC08_008590 [Ceratobasidium sp. 394]|nr:hypothetical protein FRC08_008590 [Ceratobasidium sp. 394]
MVNNREKERRGGRKNHQKRAHDDSESQVLRLKVKRPKKASTASEDKLEAGIFNKPADSTVSGLGDKDAVSNFDQAEQEELLADPNADREPSPGAEEPEEREDSTEPEPLPEINLLYHIPKDGSTSSTPCTLPSTVSFMKFRKLLAQKSNITDFDNVEVSYKLNKRPANQRPQCLDTLEEYQHLVQDVCTTLSTLTKNKKSPLPIKVFVKKRDPTPEPASAKMKSPSKASKKRGAPSKGTGDSDPESAKSNEKAWQYLRKIKADHLCNICDHAHCYVLPGNTHHQLTPHDLSVWSVGVEEGRATLSQPPPALKLSWLDQVPKQRGKPTVAPVLDPVPAPAVPLAPAPAPAANPQSDLAAFASVIKDLVTIIRAPIAPPPAPEAAPVPNAAPMAEPGDENDHQLDFPTIRDWIETISDIHPRLVPHVDTLEEHGFTHVNHLVMPEVTMKVLKDETGINLVDVILLLRLAKNIVRDVRSTA